MTDHPDECKCEECRTVRAVMHKMLGEKCMLRMVSVYSCSKDVCRDHVACQYRLMLRDMIQKNNRKPRGDQ